MQWLAEICVKRPVFAGVLMLIIVVLGGVGYGRLGLDQFPNVDVPIVLVTTRLDGAAPEEVETEITDKIEGAVNTIEGIDELRSTSSEGFSRVIITFKLEKNTDAATQDVRDKVNGIMRDLPAGIDPPVISKVDPQAAPVLLVALRSTLPIREVTEIADKRVRRQIESISGVGQVNIIGGQERQIHVWLNPVRLRSYNLSPIDVQRALAAQNLSTPGGNIETGPEAITLRIQGRVSSVDEIGRIVLRENDGHPVRIADVADVEDGAEEVASVASYDGVRSVVLQVRKQSGTNTVAVVDAVKARLGEIAQHLPAGVTLEVVRDNSQAIRTSVGAVKEHLVVGALLAALVVLFFLGNAQSTLIAAVSIPISLVGTFALMWFQGFSLNMLTLLALALAVGIVIDDAIVVLENIVRFVEEKGMKPFPAAVLATREIGLAVMATTFSLIAVFVPVAFVGGVPGRFLKNFGYTMAFAVGVSLLVSFTLTPMLAARMLKGGAHGGGFLTKVVDTFYRPVERGYMAILRASLRRRWAVVLVSGIALFTIPVLAQRLPKGFVPIDDNAQYEVFVRAPEGTSSLETALIVERVADDLRALPGVDHTVALVASGEEQIQNSASIYVGLSDPSQRQHSQHQLMDITRREILSKLPPELRVSVGEVAMISTGTSTAAVQYVLAGPDLGELGRYAEEMSAKIKSHPAVVDFDTNLIIGKPELRVAIERERAADLGVSVADIAATLRTMMAGIKASSHAEQGEEYEIRLRAGREFRSDIDALALMTVPSSKYGTVPLSSVVSSETGVGPAEVNRLGRQRQVTFMANVATGYGESDVVKVMQDAFAAVSAPAEYRLVPTGRSKSSAELGKGFLLAFALSFVFMYLILAAQFESWLNPLIILISLPLTVPFALASLFLFGQGLNLMSALGLLVLFGVVKKNAILQIDHTNQLRAAGRPRLEAILEANRDRLRPILMTTLAFVAGMIPLALSQGVGSGNNRNISGLVIGGQTFSLLLTLVAVPVAYSLFDDAKEWLAARRSRQPIDRGERELERLLAGGSPELSLPPEPRGSAAE